MIPKPSHALRRVDCRRVHDLPQLSSACFCELEIGDSCYRIADIVLPRLKLGAKYHQKKRNILALILANQITAGKRQRPVAVSRGRSRDELRNKTYDALVDIGFLICRKGSELSGRRTLYAMTTPAWRWLQQFDLSTAAICNYEVRRPTDIPPSQQALQYAPVVLRNKRKVAMEFKTTPEIEQLEDRILAINEYLLQHNYQFKREFRPGRYISEQPLVCVRSIFNNDFRHGGRLYSGTLSGYQAMTKKERSTLLINSEGCCEWDYSGFHPRLLYHKAGLECRGDVYRPSKVAPELVVTNPQTDARGVPECVRTAIKRATNICLNAKTRGKAHSAVANYYREHPAVARKLWRAGITPIDLVDRVISTHRHLQQYFFTQVGSQLTASDDLPLMLDMLERFRELKRPALGLHDAIICQQSMRDTGRQIEVDPNCWTEIRLE